MLSSSKKPLNHFLAVWDMLGLESLHDLTKVKGALDEWEKLTIMAILKGDATPSKPNDIPLQTLILRARVNTHRHYEIYDFTTELEYDEVIELFNSSPQLMADSIREKGYAIYSDRDLTKRVIV